jgi:hypothetical protein
MKTHARFVMRIAKTVEAKPIAMPAKKVISRKMASAYGVWTTVFPVLMM